MKITQSKHFNPNYCARIVKIESFQQHPNPKCERLKYATVGGYQIAVSIDTMPGIFIYFPVECALVDTYLAANSLYRDNTKNDNPDQAGFFDDNGRVRMIRLQKFPSEGLLMPIFSLKLWCERKGIEYDGEVELDVDFDSINGELLCFKYVKKIKVVHPGVHTHHTKEKKQSKVIEKQFRFHYDTILIKKCPEVIQPQDLISITAKVHGTSGISAYVKCTKKLRFFERVYNWFAVRMGLDLVSNEQYDYLYSSRKVIKNEWLSGRLANPGFYNCDVWGYADAIVRPHLIKGMTVYYEIVGYLPTGGPIQSMAGKCFDYGCKPLVEDEAYTYDKHFSIQVYRVTLTNEDGVVHEFSAKEVQQWCQLHGLHPVYEYYYGTAGNVYGQYNPDTFGSIFIQELATDKEFHMECWSPTCINQVPHEGLVIKVENGRSEAFKLKCAKFLEGETRELDTADSNIEDEG